MGECTTDSLKEERLLGEYITSCGYGVVVT